MWSGHRVLTMAVMRLLRNALVGAALALALLVGGAGIAGAHPSQGSSTPGAAGWLDHGTIGDGRYNYALSDTHPSACAWVQINWGTGWENRAYTCDATGSGSFAGPAAGISFRVCAFGPGVSSCGQEWLYYDGH
jgi:hypothetical protein